MWFLFSGNSSLKTGVHINTWSKALRNSMIKKPYSKLCNRKG